MKQLRTEITIQAPIERVWATLMDFGRYPEWNPFIQSIFGKPAVGTHLEVFICPPGNKGMTFTPKVLVCSPQQEFRWLGHLLVSGIFDGEHYFLLEAIDNQQTKLIHGESFRGLLVGLMSGLLNNSYQGFEAMNAALKSRCEAVA